MQLKRLSEQIISAHAVLRWGALVSAQQIIFAAGGLVRRQAAGGEEFLIVHRKQYGDWGLPKGKKEPHETFLLDTAMREVKEETRYECQPISFAEFIEYSIGDARKVVFFWIMELKCKIEFSPTDEVDQVRWATLPKALAIMTHQKEKELLLMVMTADPGSIGRFYYSVWRATMRQRYSRIAGAVKSYRQELNDRLVSLSGSKAPDIEHALSARKSLDDAETLLRRNRIDEAWKCLFAAQRIEVFCLKPEELEIKATMLRREVEKLGSWRKGAVEDLLGTPTQPKTKLTASHIYEALLIRDEHFSNQAYKDDIIRRRIWSLVVLLLGLTSIIVYRSGLLKFDEAISMNLSTLINVCLFGLLGGSYWAALKVPQSAGGLRIPELTGSLRITFLRVLVGGISAFVFFILLHSQGVQDMLKSVLNIDVKHWTNALAYFLCFAAGYSERLVLKAVEYVSKENK